MEIITKTLGVENVASSVDRIPDHVTSAGPIGACL